MEPLLNPGPRVTIRTVAKHAGVSVAAVSKVLRRAYGVSNGLRERVQASIDTLGYRPRTLARGMRGRTYIVGVLVTYVRNPFLPDIIDGMNDGLGRSDYKALIGVGQGDVPTETALVESMIDHGMDGLIMIAPRLPAEVIGRFAKTVPIVAIGYHSPSARDFDTVNADDAQGAELAVEHLLGRGHCDIAMLSLLLSDQHGNNVAVRREDGYRRAMTAAGLSDRARILRVPREGAEAHRLIAGLLEGTNRPRAVFCWSDLTAIELMGVAEDRGLRVPADLSVVGFDNGSVAGLPRIALTSVDQAGRVLGTWASEMLLKRIEGRSEPLHVLLEPRLVSRASVREIDASDDGPPDIPAGVLCPFSP